MFHKLSLDDSYDSSSFKNCLTLPLASFFVTAPSVQVCAVSKPNKKAKASNKSLFKVVSCYG